MINAGAKIIGSDTNRDVKKSDGGFTDFLNHKKYKLLVQVCCKMRTKTIVNVASKKFCVKQRRYNLCLQV